MSIEISIQHQSDSFPAAPETQTIPIIPEEQPWDVAFLPRSRRPEFTTDEMAKITPYDRARYTPEELAEYTPEQLDRQIYCDIRRPFTDPVYVEGQRLSRELFLAARRHSEAVLAKIAFVAANPGFLKPGEDGEFYPQCLVGEVGRNLSEAEDTLADITNRDVEFRRRSIYR